MNKPFVTMKTNVGNEIQDTDTSMASIIGVYLNNRYFQILRATNWNKIRPDYSFTTTASQQEYVLPDDFYKPLSVRDATNENELAESDLQKLISTYPDSFSDNGDVGSYYLYDDTINTQPTSASVASIVSSSASDTTQTVTIRGVASNVEITETQTLTGTSAVTTTAQWTRILNVAKSADTTGTITVTTNSGAVTVATLAPTRNTAFYKKIGFHYVPSTALSIKIPYIIKPMPMTEDYDYPLIDVADLIEKGATADAWRYKRQFQKASVFEAQFASGLSDYIWDMENKPNKVQQFSPATYNKDNLY